MTLHAPQTKARLLSLVMKRVLLNRASIVAVAAVSTTVVLAGRGEEIYPGLTPSDIGTQTPYAYPKTSHASVSFNALTSPVRAEPTSLGEPSRIDVGIPLHFRRDQEAPTAQVPGKPGPAVLRDTRLERQDLQELDLKIDAPPETSIEVASLSPTNKDWSSLDLTLSPRLPELGPVPLTPSLGADLLDTVPEIYLSEKRNAILNLVAAEGDTLEALLQRADLRDEDHRATLIALRADDLSEPLIEGDAIDFAFLAEDDNHLLAIRLRQLGKPPIELRWDGDTDPLWTVATPDNPLSDLIAEDLGQSGETLSVTGKENDTIFVAGQIDSSLYASASKVGLTASETKALTDIFRYSIDFERDLRKGDHFEALFEKRNDGTHGDILYAKLTNRGSEIALYRGVDDATGEVGYFDATGKTNKRSLMRTPVAGARVSSHFGMRRHPILGYNKMHRGTDFSAPTGTPIFAAGDGVVEYLGRNGAYGKYIRIRHNGVYDTAYAHMSRYAGGLQNGSRVRQGDVIGYVGSTGRSTGPHLHFEIIENGNQINPMNIADFGPTRGLSGSALSSFRVRVSRIEIALSLMRDGSRVANIE